MAESRGVCHVCHFSLIPHSITVTILMLSLTQIFFFFLAQIFTSGSSFEIHCLIFFFGSHLLSILGGGKGSRDRNRIQALRTSFQAKCNIGRRNALKCFPQVGKLQLIKTDVRHAFAHQWTVIYYLLRDKVRTKLFGTWSLNKKVIDQQQKILLEHISVQKDIKGIHHFDLKKPWTSMFFQWLNMKKGWTFCGKRC